MSTDNCIFFLSNSYHNQAIGDLYQPRKFSFVPSGQLLSFPEATSVLIFNFQEHPPLPPHHDRVEMESHYLSSFASDFLCST